MQKIYTTSINSLETVSITLKELKKQVNQENNDKYHVLLGEKMAETLDYISLNIPINISTTIYEYSVNELTKRINYATLNSLNSEYNFNVSGTIYITEKNIYLSLAYFNDFIKRDFSILEKNGFKEVNKVEKKIKKEIPMRVTLFDPIIPEKEKITYPSKNERIKTIARHAYENEYLNRSFCDHQIPPYELMSALDEVLISLDTREAKEIIANKEIELKTILLNLDDKEVLKTLFEKKETK